MSMSNIEYSSLKKKAGLHNWGFMSSKDEFDFDLDEIEEAEMELYTGLSPEIVHRNDYGELYALQDFEE
ncbi:MAG TPA: hypothetical protein VN132_03545 [Bdellovibrio sp.]|nr:hypothetical protein [Bdellovibrio sp.]